METHARARTYTHTHTHTHTHTSYNRFTCGSLSARLRRTFTLPNTTRSCARARVCAWVCVATYGGVEGKGALALENPISCPGHPDGGHVRDQQLSEVYSHLRIPASRTTVLRSHGAALSEERMLFLKPSVSTFLKPGGDVTRINIKIKWQRGRRLVATQAAKANEG